MLGNLQGMDKNKYNTFLNTYNLIRGFYMILEKMFIQHYTAWITT